MSINYEYLFSQIDKAKKKQKKGYIPWNSPESKKRREQQEKDQADKKRRNDEYVATHSSPGKKFVSEKLSRVAGRKRSGGKYNAGTEQKTRDTNRGRGTENLKVIADRKRKEEMDKVAEKVRAGMTAIPFGHTNERDYKNTLAEMRDAKQAQRNQDNRIARERKAARVRQGETSAEYKKRTDTKREKKEQAKQKKQTKQQAAQTKEEAYDYQKDESEGKSEVYDPDTDIYGTDEDKGDYKNASVWKSWLKEKGLKTKKPYVRDPESAKRWQKFFDGYKDKPEEAPKPKKTYTEIPSRAVGGKKFSDFEALEQFLHPDKSPKDKKIREGMVDTFGKSLWKSWLEKKERQFKEHKCTSCGETKPEVLFTNPLGKPKGICDQCTTAKNPKWLKELERDDLDEKGTPTTTRKSEEGKCANPNCDKESTITYHLGTTTGGKIDDNIKTIKVCPGCAKEIDDFASETGGKTYKIPKYDEDKLKAEEGIGGMNMGSQRGLGHEAGYKQDPGQSAQITEVVEEEIGNESKKKSHKCPECESKDIVSGQHKSKKEKRGHNTKICDDCGHEWEKKSANENHEQDEGPEVKPNKNQIPASKPGMDVIRSMYKKALITKYNNIYKPANL